MIFLAVAAAFAQSVGAGMVVTAVHAGDHAIYPDCRPEFIDRMREAMVRATGVILEAPFVRMRKEGIVLLGSALDVPYRLTYSCYRGSYSCFNGAFIHCGTCGTCVERKEAFRLAGVTDPSIYRTPPECLRQSWRDMKDIGMAAAKESGAIVPDEAVRSEEKP
jgi:7-cyano-7-deazaguanine synthase